MQRVGPLSFELPKSGEVVLSIRRSSDDTVVISLENASRSDIKLCTLPTANPSADNGSLEEKSSSNETEELAQGTKKVVKADTIGSNKRKRVEFDAIKNDGPKAISKIKWTEHDEDSSDDDVVYELSQQEQIRMDLLDDDDASSSWNSTVKKILGKKESTGKKN